MISPDTNNNPEIFGANRFHSVSTDYVNWHKVLKWRNILPFVGALLALALNSIGDRQEAIARNHIDALNSQRPGYHLAVDWQPPAITVSECINAPVVAVWSRLWERNTSINYRAGSYVFIALFWFVLGWFIDSRSAPRRWRMAAVAGNLLGFTLSLSLAYRGLMNRDAHVMFYPSFRIATIVWGLALLACFGWNLWSDFSSRSPNRSRAQQLPDKS